MNRSKWLLCLDVFIPRIFKVSIKVILIHFQLKCCMNWEIRKNNRKGRKLNLAETKRRCLLSRVAMLCGTFRLANITVLRLWMSGFTNPYTLRVRDGSTSKYYCTTFVNKESLAPIRYALGISKTNTFQFTAFLKCEFY